MEWKRYAQTGEGSFREKSGENGRECLMYRAYAGDDMYTDRPWHRACLGGVL